MKKRAEKIKKFCDDILSMNNKEDELINFINGSLIKIANHKDIISKQLVPLSGNLRTENNLDASLKINDAIVTINTLIQSNSAKIANWKNEFIEVNRRNVAFHNELIRFLEEEYNTLGILNLKKALDKTRAKEKIEKNLYRIINAITNANNLKELEIYLNNAVCARIDKIVNVNKMYMASEGEYLQTYINFKVNPETKIDFFKLESNLLILSQQISEQIELERSSYISSFGVHTKNKERILKVIRGFLTTRFIDRFNSRYFITKREIKKDIKIIDSSLVKEYEDVVVKLSALGFCAEFSHEEEKKEPSKEDISVVDADDENEVFKSPNKFEDEDDIDEFARKIASA